MLDSDRVYGIVKSRIFLELIDGIEPDFVDYEEGSWEVPLFYKESPIKRTRIGTAYVSDDDSSVEISIDKDHEDMRRHYPPHKPHSLSQTPSDPAIDNALMLKIQKMKYENSSGNA
ncbi:MAG: hypothetical protein V1870_05240 [Candidatus Aenigmatarchaeota archaeon]